MPGMSLSLNGFLGAIASMRSTPALLSSAVAIARQTSRDGVPPVGIDVKGVAMSVMNLGAFCNLVIILLFRERLYITRYCTLEASFAPARAGKPAGEGFGIVNTSPASMSRDKSSPHPSRSFITSPKLTGVSSSMAGSVISGRRPVDVAQEFVTVLFEEGGLGFAR